MPKNEKQTPKAVIEVQDHPKFEGDMKTNIISTIDMADIVSSLFAPALSDYYGCKFRINDGRNPVIANSVPFGAIYVDLYFKDQGESDTGFKTLTPKGQKAPDGSDLASRFMKVNGAMNNSNVYDISKDTFECLEKFVFGNGQNVRWRDRVTEISSTMSVYGKEEVVVEISGLSLNKIITEIYGDKTDDGRFEYIATPSTFIPSSANEFILQISQLDLSAVRNLQKTLGIYTANSPQFHRYSK